MRAFIEVWQLNHLLLEGVDVDIVGGIRQVELWVCD